MTFEEFFFKKRIDLQALEKAESSLFSEFKTHFEQMGEKSFDHTKKYWFNKLRRQYHLPPELKPEKVHIANPLAEQTIAESLSETITAKPESKVGFVPRFKVASMAKPAVEVPKSEEQLPVEDQPAAEKQAESEPPKPSPKLGFVPKFKAANMAKPAAEPPKSEEKLPAEDQPATEKEPEPEAPKPKLGFTPKFKAANMAKPADEATKTEEKPAVEDQPAAEKETQPDTPKPAYKPRFNMKNMPPKTGE